MTLLNTINVGGTDFGLLNSTAIGACSTPAGNEVKECTFANSFELKAGVVVAVTFTYANTYGNGSTTYPKLSVNGTSYPIRTLNGRYTQSGSWNDNALVPFVFTGTDFKMPDTNDAPAFDHNVPRWVDGHLGKDITAYVTDGTLWQRLNGTNGFSLFEDIYAGDYWQMSRAISAPNQDSQYAVTGSQWVTIAGINTLRGNGDNISMDYNHLVMVPGKGETGSFHFGRKRMNSTNTTVGGYVASEMYTATLGDVVSAGSTAAGATINQQLYAEFGSHLKTTRELLSNSMGASLTNRFGSAGGASNNWGWYSCQACLMSEVEVYGSTVWSSSGYDIGSGCKQLPLFAFSKKAINNRSSYYWLKDVASSANFAFVDNYGGASYGSASYALNCVRPRFVLGA